MLCEQAQWDRNHLKPAFARHQQLRPQGTEPRQAFGRVRRLEQNVNNDVDEGKQRGDLGRELYTGIDRAYF